MLLTIEKLIYGGDGLAHLPADEHGRGKAVFVPFVLEGERVEAAPVEEKPGFVRARLERVVAPSPLRTEPPCPYFFRCGGCHYQHTSYQHQLEIKAAVLRENLARFAKLEWKDEIVVHPSPPLHYRNRTRLQVRTEPEFTLAYYRHGSHELLPVERCPISSELINRAMAAVWAIGRNNAVPRGIREIEFFANESDAQLLTELYLDCGPNERELAAFSEAFSDALPELVGIGVFRLEARERQFKEPVQVGAAGEPEIAYRVGDVAYRVSAGSFFQTNRHLTPGMVEAVTGGRAGKLALDLYAGVGLFSLPLAQSFERVIAVEASPISFADLKRNATRNVRAVHDTTDSFLAKSAAAADLVVVDPPRAGLGEKVTRALVQMNAPRVAYVSCDPATLARDLRSLLAGGYHVEKVLMFDLFPQTFHVESLVQLVR